MRPATRAEAEGRTIGEGIKKWRWWVQPAGATREQRRHVREVRLASQKDTRVKCSL